MTGPNAARVIVLLMVVEAFLGFTRCKRMHKITSQDEASILKRVNERTTIRNVRTTVKVFLTRFSLNHFMRRQFF